MFALRLLKCLRCTVAWGDASLWVMALWRPPGSCYQEVSGFSPSLIRPAWGRGRRLPKHTCHPFHFLLAFSPVNSLGPVCRTHPRQRASATSASHFNLGCRGPNSWGCWLVSRLRLALKATLKVAILSKEDISRHFPHPSLGFSLIVSV